MYWQVFRNDFQIGITLIEQKLILQFGLFIRFLIVVHLVNTTYIISIAHGLPCSWRPVAACRFLSDSTRLIEDSFFNIIGRHFGQQLTESSNVSVVKWRINFIEDTERRRIQFKDGKHQRDRSQCLFPA